MQGYHHILILLEELEKPVLEQLPVRVSAHDFTAINLRHLSLFTHGNDFIEHFFETL